VVAWDVEVKNQNGEPVAIYTILTLVRRSTDPASETSVEPAQAAVPEPGKVAPTA
jgi:oxepin-CoA hydrolase/3-oxo-5,6-dehydrosuberyl-CoA semialdehyde dehydrogenase